MPVEFQSRPSHWWCWRCHQRLRSWEPPLLMLSSLFFVQPKLMRVCIVHAWVKYEAGPALMVVPLHLSCSMIQFVVDWDVGVRYYRVRKALIILSRYTTAMITVLGWAGGKSIIGPNEVSLFGLLPEAATSRSCCAMKPAHSTDLNIVLVELW